MQFIITLLVALIKVVVVTVVQTLGAFVLLAVVATIVNAVRDRKKTATK